MIINDDRYFNDCEDRNKDLTKILSPQQIKDFKAICTSEALLGFGGASNLLKLAGSQKGIEWKPTKEEWDEHLKILSDYQKKLNKLKADTMAKILKTMPEEMKDATNYAMGVEGLGK